MKQILFHFACFVIFPSLVKSQGGFQQIFTYGFQPRDVFHSSNYYEADNKILLTSTYIDLNNQYHLLLRKIDTLGNLIDTVLISAQNNNDLIITPENSSFIDDKGIYHLFTNLFRGKKLRV